MNFDILKRPRRQDWNGESSECEKLATKIELKNIIPPTGELIEAGMFYHADVDLLKRNLFQNDDCGVVEIELQDAMEIDTPHDLEIARLLMEMRN